MSEQLTTSDGITLDGPRYGEAIEIRIAATRRLTPSQFAAAKREVQKTGARYVDGAWRATLTEGRCEWAVATMIRRDGAVVTYAD